MAKQKTTNIVGRLIQKVKDVLAQVNRNTQNIATLTSGGGGSTPTWKDITSSYTTRTFNDGDIVKITAGSNELHVMLFQGVGTKIGVNSGGGQHPMLIEFQWAKSNNYIVQNVINLIDGHVVIPDKHLNITKFEILE